MDGIFVDRRSLENLPGYLSASISYLVISVYELMQCFSGRYY
jgi:hypothetical protein